MDEKGGRMGYSVLILSPSGTHINDVSHDFDLQSVVLQFISTFLRG